MTFELKNNKINAYNIRLTLLLIYRKFPFIHLLHGKFELYRLQDDILHYIHLQTINHQHSNPNMNK